MAVRKQGWVLLSYRLPREPSTPRITVWRKLERLGVARLGDGLVGLPADARTREQFDWLAEEIVEAGGSATVWLGAPASAAHEQAIVDELREARAAEYRLVIEQAAAVDPDDATGPVRRLREAVRRIERRDFFRPPEREQAQAAIEALATGSRPARSR